MAGYGGYIGAAGTCVQQTCLAKRAGKKQAQETDQEQALTIQQQMQADEAKNQVERQKIQEDLKTSIMNTIQDTTQNKQKGALKSAEANDSYIRM